MNIEDLTPKARRTRLALLEAAGAEIGNRGVSGVTVLAVCKRAGVGRTSFYNYFEDTGALVSAVAQEVSKDIKERFDALHSGIPRGRVRLESCLRMILETAANDPEVILLVTSLVNSVPEIIKLLHAEISAELATFARLPGKDQPVLADHLTQTILALAHQLATGNLSANSIDRHVEFMMCACG